jgi:hypothetical protein
VWEGQWEGWCPPINFWAEWFTFPAVITMGLTLKAVDRETGSVRAAPGLVETVRWAAVWVGFPIIAIAILPILIILAGDLASFALTVAHPASLQGRT